MASDPRPGGKNPIRAGAPTGQRVTVEALITILQRKLLEEGPATCIVDREGRLLYRNKAYERIADALAAAGRAPKHRVTGGGNGAGRSGAGSSISLTLNVAGRTEHYTHYRHELGLPPVVAEAHIFERTTRLHTTAASLAQSTSRLEDMTRLVSDWVWETDETLRFTFVSPRISEVLGYLPREMIGRRLTDLPSKHGDSLRRVVKNEASTPFRDVGVEIQDKSGVPHRFLLSGLPVYSTSDGEFLGLRGTAKDVTELHAREAALVEAKETAELANRTKTEFLSNMSHELRTPLNAVIGFSEIMESELLGPLGSAQYKSYAHDIHESAEHLLGLINDILDVAKVEAGGHLLDEDVIDPYELAESARRLVAERSKSAGQMLRMHMPEGLPKLRGDERKLRQVLLNLLSNSVKFTDKGGLIELTAELEADGKFAFLISDSGIGIAAADIPRAFAPFEQVDNKMHRQHKGTGLGLPLSVGFMKLHGGSLELESEPGVGTRAIVRLPAERVV